MANIKFLIDGTLNRPICVSERRNPLQLVFLNEGYIQERLPLLSTALPLNEALNCVRKFEFKKESNLN